MFCNFNEIFLQKEAQKQAQEQTLLKSDKIRLQTKGYLSTNKEMMVLMRAAREVQEKFLGKCATCKHQIYKPTFDHNTMDDFKSLYCGLREDTYRITSFSTCENYEEKPLDDVLEEINRSFIK